MCFPRLRGIEGGEIKTVRSIVQETRFLEDFVMMNVDL